VIERNSIQANWLYSYLICKRQAWLISRGIEGYQKNEYLDLGRLIHEKTYSRYKHEEILLPGIKIDVFYKDKKSIAIGEIKSSNRRLEQAKKQLLYYCYILKQNGIEIEGELLIPKEKKRIRIQLTPEKEKEIEKIIEEIKDLISQPKPPEPSRISSCSKCSYFEFCWG